MRKLIIRETENRVSYQQLDKVCSDCADFLKHACVECVDCPVNRLKRRLNGHKTKKEISRYE